MVSRFKIFLLYVKVYQKNNEIVAGRGTPSRAPKLGS